MFSVAELAPGLLIVIDFGTLPQVPVAPDIISDNLDLTVDQRTVHEEVKSRLL